MRFVDTHVHLDSDEFAADLDAVLAESRAAGVSRWINVGYNEERWASTEGLVRSVEGMACMLGVHPGHADVWSNAIRDRLRARIEAVRPVAVGEAGIDLYWRQDNLDAQRRAFLGQVALARDADLPLVIHMRDADAELLRAIEAEVVLPHLHFHSFDGTDDLRAWVLDTGATIGVGGLLTRRGSEDLRAWLATLPRERIVLETDAPYLKPRGIRGKRNVPAYLVKAAEMLAELWMTDLESVAAVTTANAERIFGLGQENV
jgi:TatD DNase family protein